MQQETNTKNLLIAMVLIMGIMGLAQVFIWGPDNKRAQEAFEQNQAETAAAQQASGRDTTATDTTADTVRAGTIVDRSEALDIGSRLPFEGGAADGSIRLQGARLDDIRLKRHFETLEDKETGNREGEVKVMSPQGSNDAFYASLGWARGEEGTLVTNALTDWQVIEGTTLTPSTPVTLQYVTDSLAIQRVIEIDENYMFTFTDTVTNTGSAETILRPYGVLRQFGLPDDLSNFYILHEGLVGAMDGKLILKKYKALAKGESVAASTEKGGWIGFTSKYWLGALIPAQDEPFTVNYQLRPRAGAEDVLEARFDGSERIVAAGQSITVTNRVFGGAKRFEILKEYETNLSIPRFNDAIDWGTMFFWLTKPFFTVLTWINGYVGNFGVSILILTVIVKGIFFPIQNKAYESMTRMKKLQEPMKEIRERFAADKQRQQQEIIELYRREKVNPVAGCLPILIQIPVFYALYKTLFVTLEMRHEPFFGWIKDLSAPDPSALGNLFGLLPWSAESVASIPLLGIVLGVGILPILYGVTMWALQSLSPPPPDETQRLIFGFLPIIFTFVFAGFAAGLVIYWAWSNILSIAQQYVIMRRNGVDTQFDKLLARLFGKDKKEA